MIYRSILISGSDFINFMDLLAREGSMFEDFVAEKIIEISIFSAQQDVGMQIPSFQIPQDVEL